MSGTAEKYLTAFDHILGIAVQMNPGIVLDLVTTIKPTEAIIESILECFSRIRECSFQINLRSAAVGAPPFQLEAVIKFQPVGLDFNTAPGSDGEFVEKACKDVLVQMADFLLCDPTTKKRCGTRALILWSELVRHKQELNFVMDANSNLTFVNRNNIIL